MLNGRSEYWAVFPPACANLQLDTSSFTCFSLGYPPFPLPLLPQPETKTFRNKRPVSFASGLSSPKQETQTCWPTTSFAPAHPLLHPRTSGWPVTGGSALRSEMSGGATSVGAVPWPQKGCLIGNGRESCFIWAEQDSSFLFFFYPFLFLFPPLSFFFLSPFLSLPPSLFHSLSFSLFLPFSISPPFSSFSFFTPFLFSTFSFYSSFCSFSLLSSFFFTFHSRFSLFLSFSQEQLLAFGEKCKYRSMNNS